IALDIEERCGQMDRAMDVETIQDWVEADIMKHGKYTVAKHYITYRYERSIVRQANTTDKQILSLLNFENEEVKQENSNKNPTVNSVQRDYMAGEVSKDITKRFLLPDDIVEAHEKGLIHFHDADYFAQHMHNCCLVNLEDMLQNGTVISEVMIEKPHSFSTACNIATQAIAQIASSQYGGQSITLSHLAPFVQVSRDKYRREVKKEFEELGLPADEETINKAAEMRVKAEIVQGVQMIQYQVITLMTTNGQAPFVTIFMYLDEVPEGQTRDDLAAIIEEMLRQRIQGVKNEKGVFITPAFPKLIYALDEDNVREGTKYWYLTELAAKCTAKRMVPDYISAKVMRELKGGDVYTCMGCRSFLTPDRFTDKGIGNIAKAKNYKPGQHKYYGRFNQGVVTLNLVDIACSSGKDMKKFWKIFDERLELCRRALMLRHERLKGTASDVAPILWQNGALARLEKGETIDKLLYDGYSTISLGYAGLCECVRYMTGASHTDPNSTPFALEVMKYLNDACAKWKAETNIDFSIYGTPLESTTYKFARCLQTRFGIIEGVTDKNYITNSYHVHVTEEINAFDKLSFESQFQALSPGGAISYVEVPNMQQNIEGVLAVMQFIYDNIMYAELNTKSDYCQVCGFDGEIQIVKEDGKLLWECPNFGNRDQSKLNVARRTCGYIGTQFWNQGRTQEIMDRVMHL
ncbi:MAG: anaerobic ribonucleoside-triphosphate reductase, partial [Ruminococcus sp.]|nr:anaerobic ribonucleoside-triphosphate reductase [Ruminococcus sp.]